ncbi:Endopolyphosphatase Ppn1p-like protein [Penicillium alfredii]|uniref:Endopolyphosphatase n=1 Tax=Penicillium alfredii TaxID=1506179 RepID=A0A9W9F170_9EURO|nr:Endopolyphosphatase Ppn1p-like protein [Penicillium alfredii]KAJ5091778.1 Endopolyphosphatase Ppn1p-like protein [Penicillium alfredii]
MQSILALLGLLAGAFAVPVDQEPLGDATSVGAEFRPGAQEAQASTRGLHGRFLHITDFHPDRHYRPGSSIDDTSCHRGDGKAGYFGAQGTDCDAPLSLVNETFRWIEENLKNEIDFVIWTGDSARHDNDERLPRSPDEVMELNELLAQKFITMFNQGQSTGSEKVPRLSVPVVPTIGNNDVMPHNIFKEGPNRWTKRFAKVWNEFIPEDQRHSFVEGGWFTTEVIPGQLAVISLNTMYFFESNTAVDGCKDKSEPGYEHMEWLRVQLQLLRNRNIKAILMGHVPPARSSEKRSWDETCWQKYTFWVHSYRDVITGSFYGHMNIDHFMLQDSNEVKIAPEAEDSADDRMSVWSKSGYLASLREQWSTLPSPPSGLFEGLGSQEEDIDEATETDSVKKGKNDKKNKEKTKRRFLEKIGGPWAERYSVTLVAPSLVPNFFPTLRVIEYNITGVGGEPAQTNQILSDEPEVDPYSGSGEMDESPASEFESSSLETDKKKKHGKKKKKKKPDFKVPDPPSPTAPPGPAYSNQAFSLLSYTQYFANLTRINAAAEGQQDPRVDFEVEYSTNDDIYQMKDLTTRSFFQLASQIGEDDGIQKKELAGGDSPVPDSDPSTRRRKKANKVWRAFLSRAFVGYLDVDELD